jgi:hypothetical protein
MADDYDPEAERERNAYASNMAIQPNYPPDAPPPDQRWALGALAAQDRYQPVRDPWGIGTGLPDVGAPAIPPGPQISAGVPAVNRAADIASQVPGRMMGSLLGMPQALIENSQQSLNTGTYDPRGPVNAALMTMGAGGIAGVPVQGAEKVLGAGIVRDPALWHGISSVKLPKPIDEMSAVHVPTGTSTESIIRPADLQGSRLLPLIGDRSAAGSNLVQVNGFPFADPVAMQGGHGFMSQNAGEGAAWASQENVIKGLARKVATEAKGGEPIHGVYTAMGDQSADFSHHVSDTLAEMLKHTSGDQASRAAFDAAMQKPIKDFPAVPDWPGVGSDKLRQYFEDSWGNVRSKFAKLMDTAQFQSKGFPSVAEARYAVADPRLLNEATGTSGLSIAKLDPSGRVFSAPGAQHRTYDTNLGGQYVGGLPASVPKEIMYPDIVAPLQQYANATQARTGFKPSVDYLMNRTPKGLPQTQIADQRWVDSISKYLTDRGFTGLGVAGALGMGGLAAQDSYQSEERM